MPPTRLRVLTAFALALVAPWWAAAPAVAAADSAVPAGVVSLSSSASVDVTKDELSVTFNTTREGPDAATVQSQLKQALDAALTEAKKAVRPGQLEVQTGNFSMSPRYTSKGQISGWQGSAELNVQGRDAQAIGQLSGRIATLTVSRVGYSLSRELREKSEAEVSGQAIARFRAKSEDYARAFGFAGYAIREVSVSTNDTLPTRFPAPMRMAAMASAAEEPLPLEPGKGTVTVTVSGSVQLLK